MRFKHFILESIGGMRGEGDYTVAHSDDAQWASWVRKNCAQYLERAAKNPIYRGFGELDDITLGIKDTNTFTRRSANTANYYTLWMDNAAAWKGYPKRSKAYIGSTDDRHASDFGTLFQLFPADDALIGVVPNSDLWVAFGQVPGYDMGDFAFALERGFENLYSREIARSAMFHWDDLKDLLEDTNIKAFADAAFWVKKNTHLAAFKGFGPNLIDYFENYLIPEGHGFKKFTAATFSAPSGRLEVWVQGKVALLNVEKINKADFPETVGLLKEFKIELP